MACRESVGVKVGGPIRSLLIQSRKFLKNGFIDELNEKFSYQPLSKIKLNDVLC
jgi:hypothetical protein